MSRREEVMLKALKESKRLDLKKLRDETIDEPINDVQVARVEDRENINGSIELMEANSMPSMNWVMVDNTITNLTLQELKTIRDIYITRKMQTYALYGELVNTLSNATTVEEVEALSW